MAIKVSEGERERGREREREKKWSIRETREIDRNKGLTGLLQI